MDTIQIITTGFGIIGFAGGAVGYFAKGRGDSIIAYQEKQNLLLQNDVTRLEKSLASTTAENNLLKQQNETLTKLAQGSPQLEKLTKQIKDLVYLQKREKK